MKLFFEKIYPYFFGIIAAVIWLELGCVFPKADAILSSTLTVSGILVGFLATSKAILMSMNSPIILELKKSGYIHELVNYIGHAIWLNLLFCTINVIGYFITQTSLSYSTIWIGMAVAAMMSFVRVTHIMLSIFKYN